jgi:hypothetical protein
MVRMIVSVDIADRWGVDGMDEAGGRGGGWLTHARYHFCLHVGRGGV